MDDASAGSRTPGCAAPGTPHGEEVPVLVVVVNDPLDLARAQREGWYRIPFARAPRRIAAEYLALYLTAAFAEDERWVVRWLAPIYGYQVVTRSELIPGEPDHPHAADLYYKVKLGPLQPLDRPVPSRRLRRITFISTTLERLLAADEINDLWIKSTAQQRFWESLKQMRIEAERQYPIDDDLPHCVADFALPGPAPTALIVVDEPRDGQDGHALGETFPPDYLMARGGWQVLRATIDELWADPIAWARRFCSAGDSSQAMP